MFLRKVYILGKYSRIMKLSAIITAFLLAIPLVAAQAQSIPPPVPTAVLGFVVVLIVLSFILGILGTAFWIWMLVDCATRKTFKNDSDKVVWIVVMVFLQALGAIIYYFVVKRKHSKS